MGATVEGVPLPWRHTVVLLEQAPGVPALADHAARWVEAWAQHPWIPQRLLRAALRYLHPDEASRCLLRGATRRPGHDARPFADALVAFNEPHLWTVLCALALWPRGRARGQAIRAALQAHDRDGDWRALLLESLHTDLPDQFGLAGFTARGELGSVQHLRAALFEEAMCAGACWSPAAWARVAPHVPDGVLWEQTDTGVTIVHPTAITAKAESAVPEPFAQRSRKTFRLRTGEGRQRMITRFRERDVPAGRMQGALLRRGWARGEVLDYPRVMELYRRSGGWCAYIRFFPGISEGRADEPQRIHGVSFLRGAQAKPEWGGWRNSGQQGHADNDRDPGVLLSAVPPRVISETLRDVSVLFR